MKKITQLFKNSTTLLTSIPALAVTGAIGYGVYLFWPAIKAGLRVASSATDTVNSVANTAEKYGGGVFDAIGAIITHPIDSITQSGKWHLSDGSWVPSGESNVKYDSNGNPIYPTWGNDDEQKQNMQYLMTYGGYGNSGSYTSWHY